MSNNREFSQLASNIIVKEGENYIGISTDGTQTVSVATANITFDGTTGYINASGFYKDGLEITASGGGSGAAGIQGITIQDETTTVGTAGSIQTLQFKGNLITAIADENQGIATITVSTPTNVATADSLSSSVNIGGVSFDGSSSINLAGVNSEGNQDTTGNAATASLATTATTATNVGAGNTGDILYQYASGISSFLSPGTDNFVLKSNGGLSAPSWVDVNTLTSTTINFADNSGISTSVIGGIASVTSLSVSGISTLSAINQDLYTPTMPLGLNNDIGEKFVKIEMEDGTNFIETFYTVVYCGDGIVIAGGGVDEGDGDIYRSTDYGRTWIRIDTTDLGNPFLIRSGVYCGNGIILLGSGHNTFSNPEVLRSTDYGLTWSRVTISSTTSNITSDLVYCGISTVVVSTIPSSTSLQISSDNGATWSSLTAFGNNGGSQDSVEYLGNDILLAGVRNTFDNKSDIHRSTDFGSTWNIIDMGNDIEYIYSIKYLENGIVLAGSGSDSGDGDIHRSTDYGQTWDKIEMGSDLEYIFSIEYIGNGIVLAGGGAGSGDGDVYKSSDYGLTWTKVFNTTLKAVLDIENCGNGIILFGSGTDSGTGDIFRSDVGFSQASTIQGIYHQHLTGNIGIGSDEPTSDLDVAGTANFENIYISNSTRVNTDTSNFFTVGVGTENILQVKGDPSLNINGSADLYYSTPLNLHQGQSWNPQSKLRLEAQGNGGHIDWNDTSNPLYVESANNITFRKGSGANEKSAVFTPTGSAELYHNNFKKLETTNGGVKVTGNLEVTSVITASGIITQISGDGSGLTNISAVTAYSSTKSSRSTIADNISGISTYVEGQQFNMNSTTVPASTKNTSTFIGVDVASGRDGKVFFTSQNTVHGIDCAGDAVSIFEKTTNTFNYVGFVTALSHHTLGSNLTESDLGNIFGPYIETNSDGSIFAVGSPQAPRDNTNQSDFFTGINNYSGTPGNVHVFEKDGSTISSLGIITCPSEYANTTLTNVYQNASRFGRSMAMSSDGTKLYIGAPGTIIEDPSNAPVHSGVVLAYDKVGTSYQYVGIVSSNRSDVGNDAIQRDYFGEQVACSDDGNTIYVSAPRSYIPGGIAQEGLVEAFSRTGNSFTSVGILTGSVGSNWTSGNFGITLDCSSDGSIISIGAKPSNTGNDGALFVYKKDGSNFNKISEIVFDSNGIDSDLELAQYANKITSDGSTIYAGLSQFQSSVNDPSGYFAVFAVEGDNVYQKTAIRPSDPQIDPVNGDLNTYKLFGASLAVSDDHVFVGAPLHPLNVDYVSSTLNGFRDKGSVFIYDHSRLTSLYSNQRTGYLGIGSATPQAPLDIVGDVIVSSKIGIGTATPQAPLDVVGEIKATSLSTPIGIGTFDIVANNDNNGTLNFNASEGTLFSISNNLTTGTLFAVTDISGIPTIEVDADGRILLGPYSSTEKVGIGVTNPSYKVDVDGDIRAGQTSSEGLILTSPNGTKYRLSVDNSGNLSTGAV